MSAYDNAELAEGPGVGTGEWIDNGLGLDEGLSVGTDDSPGFAKGLADELDKG